MSEKPWSEMTPAERSAHMHLGRERRRREREEAAAAAPPIVEPEAELPLASEPDFFAPVELTDAEVEQINAWALAEAKKEQKQRKVEAMKIAALASARERMGLVVVKPKDRELARLEELVSVTIDIPEGGARDGDFIWLDGKPFANGMTYPVTRAVYETIRDICNKQWVQWSLFKGEKTNHYLRMRGRHGLTDGQFMQAYGGGHPTGSMGRGLQTPHAGIPAHMEQDLSVE